MSINNRLFNWWCTKPTDDFLNCINLPLLLQLVSTSKQVRMKKVKVTTLVSYLLLVHKQSLIQLRKSSAGLEHHQLNNRLLIDINKKAAILNRGFFCCLWFGNKSNIKIKRLWCKSQPLCYICIIGFQNKRATWKFENLRIYADAIRSFFCFHHARF